MLADIYNVILYQPIFNILVFFYNIVPGHDIGLAIILLTILIKVVLSPFFVQSIKAQRAMQRLQPKLDELKEKYKDNKEKLGPAIMQLYQKEKVSPFSSCIPLLIQLPFLIAVFQVFRVGLGNGTLDIVYPFIYNPGQINHIAFGFIDFSQASIALAVLAGLAQFIQSKSLLGKKNQLGGAKPSAMTAAMELIRMSRFLIWASSWARTPSSSSRLRMVISPRVTATAAWAGFLPVAKALGVSLSMI